MADAHDPVVIAGQIEVHPAACHFPEMGEEDFAALKASIAEHGMRVPVVTQHNRIVDGRNRARAWLELGRPIAEMPVKPVPESVDPFALAFDLNCERLEYTPGLKARIHAEIKEASGELARIAAEAKAAADALRAEKSKAQIRAQPRAADGKVVPGAPSRGGAPGKKPKRVHKAKAAQAVAAAAGVSPSTAERQMAKAPATSGSGHLPAGHPLLAKRPPATKWGEPPHDVAGLAKYLTEHLDEDDFRALVRALSFEVEAA